MSSPRSSESYLPPDLVNNSPLLKKLSAITDFVLSTQHHTHMDTIVGHYRTNHSSYDPVKVIDELGGTRLLDDMRAEGFDYSEEGMASFLMGFYAVRGTVTGIVIILNMLGLQAEVFDWQEVQLEISAGTQQGLNYAAQGGLNGLTNCQTIISVTTNNSQLDLLNPAVEEALIRLIRSYSWVCSDIQLRLGLVLESVLIPLDELEIDQVIEVVQTVCTNDQSVPPALFNIGSFIIGSPIAPDPTAPIISPYYPSAITGACMSDTWEMEKEIDDETNYLQGFPVPIAIGTFVIGDGTTIAYVDPTNDTFYRDELDDASEIPLTTSGLTLLNTDAGFEDETSVTENYLQIPSTILTLGTFNIGAASTIGSATAGTGYFDLFQVTVV